MEQERQNSNKSADFLSLPTLIRDPRYASSVHRLPVLPDCIQHSSLTREMPNYPNMPTMMQNYTPHFNEHIMPTPEMMHALEFSRMQQAKAEYMAAIASTMRVPNSPFEVDLMRNMQRSGMDWQSKSQDQTYNIFPDHPYQHHRFGGAWSEFAQSYSNMPNIEDPQAFRSTYAARGTPRINFLEPQLRQVLARPSMDYMLSGLHRRTFAEAMPKNIALPNFAKIQAPSKRGRGKKKNVVVEKPLRKPYSMYRGVSWSKGKNRWQANIRINRTQKFLGLYPTEKEAADAYDNAARTMLDAIEAARRVNFRTSEETALLGSVNIPVHSSKMERIMLAQKNASVGTESNPTLSQEEVPTEVTNISKQETTEALVTSESSTADISPNSTNSKRKAETFINSDTIEASHALNAMKRRCV